MTGGKQRAIVILSEGRSGTTFFASRINATGQMGIIDEWFDLKVPKPRTFEALYQEVISRGSTENGTLGLKLFPRHMYAIQQKYGVDLLTRLGTDYDLFTVFIERKDRALQAISFSRALQSGAWTKSSKQDDFVYDFAQLCRLYFFIGESYEFWRSYLAARQMQYEHGYYEDIVTSDKILQKCAAFCGLPDVEFPKSDLKVQRTASTDDIKVRFLEDLRRHDIVSHHAKLQVPDPTTKNAMRLLSKKPTRPVPFSY